LVDVLHGRIVVGEHRLVRGQLLKLPPKSYVLGETLVGDPLNVGVSEGTFLSGDVQSGVQLRQVGPVGSLFLKDIVCRG